MQCNGKMMHRSQEYLQPHAVVQPQQPRAVLMPDGQIYNVLWVPPDEVVPSKQGAHLVEMLRGVRNLSDVMDGVRAYGEANGHEGLESLYESTVLVQKAIRKAQGRGDSWLRLLCHCKSRVRWHAGETLCQGERCGERHALLLDRVQCSYCGETWELGNIRTRERKPQYWHPFYDKHCVNPLCSHALGGALLSVAECGPILNREPVLLR